MIKNAMPLVFGAACIAIGVLGYWLYAERNRSAVELSVGGRTLTLEAR